jgi:hypothetical protein
VSEKRSQKYYGLLHWDMSNVIFLSDIDHERWLDQKIECLNQKKATRLPWIFMEFAALILGRQVLIIHCRYFFKGEVFYVSL